MTMIAPPVTANTSIQISYMDGIKETDLDEQRDILRARRYYAGRQIVFLTDRMREYLNLNDKRFTGLDDFHLNIIQTIVIAVLDELSINSFDTSEKGDAEGVKEQTQWAKEVWDLNRMALKQHNVHEAALRDSCSYVLVDFDDVAKQPRLTWHERFIDVQAGGNGYGFWMIYKNGDETQKPTAAIKEWVQTETKDDKPYSFRRRNIYYPNRIEKFKMDPDWQQYDDGSGNWPTPWVTIEGEPIGLPVFPFENFGGDPEAKEALPLQDAINKMMLDVMGEADGAFKIFFGTGMTGTTDGNDLKSDGSNQLNISPMSLITSESTEARLEGIEGGDPTKLMNTLKEIIMLAGQITGTPTSYFSVTKQIAGVDTLKGQDKPLTKKVEKRKDIFGQSWEDVITMARRVANVFGNAQLDEKVKFYAQWKQVFDLDTITMMRNILGVPRETLWRLYGMTEEQISAMKKTDDYRLFEISLKMQETLLKTAQNAANNPPSLFPNPPADNKTASATDANPLPADNQTTMNAKVNPKMPVPVTAHLRGMPNAGK